MGGIVAGGLSWFYTHVGGVARNKGCGPLSYKKRQEALLLWLREFDTVFCDYYLSSCFRLRDEVVMGRQEVDLHRLQNESGLTQLY